MHVACVVDSVCLLMPLKLAALEVQVSSSSFARACLYAWPSSQQRRNHTGQRAGVLGHLEMARVPRVADGGALGASGAHGQAPGARGHPQIPRAPFAYAAAVAHGGMNRGGVGRLLGEGARAGYRLSCGTSPLPRTIAPGLQRPPDSRTPLQALPISSL